MSPIDQAYPPLLSATIRACLYPDAHITTIEERLLTHGGFSGAEMHLFDIGFSQGQQSYQTVTLLVKDAPLNERQALTTLYRQGHRAIPYCYALDLVSERPAPLCMQYIQMGQTDPGENLISLTAQELASIHFRNLGNRELLAWAPPADKCFFEGDYVLNTWRTGWNKLLADSDFATEFGQYNRPLEAAASVFLFAMEHLWEEGQTLTLIHADLHDGNVLIADGNPYILDWGQAHYGTFFIDLPNLLHRAEIPVYYETITKLGFPLSVDVFLERYCQAGRYVGFKYMAFVMAGWADRNQPGNKVRPHLNNLIHLALNGA